MKDYDNCQLFYVTLSLSSVMKNRHVTILAHNREIAEQVIYNIYNKEHISQFYTDIEWLNTKRIQYESICIQNIIIPSEILTIDKVRHGEGVFFVGCHRKPCEEEDK